MNVTPNQKTVLLALNNDWKTPLQIAGQLNEGNLEAVNEALKELTIHGLAQVNPVILGMYRLTEEGTVAKANISGG